MNIIRAVAKSAARIARPYLPVKRRLLLRLPGPHPKSADQRPALHGTLLFRQSDSVLTRDVFLRNLESRLTDSKRLASLPTLETSQWSTADQKPGIGVPGFFVAGFSRALPAHTDVVVSLGLFSTPEDPAAHPMALGFVHSKWGIQLKYRIIDVQHVGQSRRDLRRAFYFPPAQPFPKPRRLFLLSAFLPSDFFCY